MKLNKERELAWEESYNSKFSKFLKDNYENAGVKWNKQSFEIGFDKGVKAERARIRKVMDFLCDQYLGPLDKNHLVRLFGEEKDD